MTTPENAFAAPEANLTNTSLEKPVLEFKRFSAWGVFGLSIITFGIYFIYWLYTRANKANTLSIHKKANINFLNAYFVLYAISIALNIFAGQLDGILAIVSLVVSLVQLIVFYMFIYSLRAAVREIINIGSQEEVKVGGILTFFFSGIYFQYKINEAIDNQKIEE